MEKLILSYPPFHSTPSPSIGLSHHLRFNRQTLKLPPPLSLSLRRTLRSIYVCIYVCVLYIYLQVNDPLSLRLRSKLFASLETRYLTARLCAYRTAVEFALSCLRFPR